jgi:hypothetical protein
MLGLLCDPDPVRRGHPKSGLTLQGAPSEMAAG